MDVHGTKLVRTLFTIATGVNAVPPNKGMELTGKSDTPFAKRRAKGAPLLPAAHPRRSADELNFRSEMNSKIGTKFRFTLGFGLGLILSACALFLSGAGHGTYAPMIANVSLLALIPGLGFLLALLGTPFLWAIYFVLIPEIDSLSGRIIALVLISSLHIVPGIWLASEDSAFSRALESHFLVVVFHGASLAAAIISLALFVSLESRHRKEYA